MSAQGRALDALADELRRHERTETKADRLPYYADKLRELGYTVHEPGVGCPARPLPMPHASRLTDPTTSHEAEPSLPSAESVAFAMLELIAGIDRLDGWTADELALALAADPAPEVRARAAGSWRRLSDLKRLGLVEAATLGGDLGDKPQARPGRSGRMQVAYRVSSAGRALIASQPGEEAAR